ncbi:Laminin subunit alpha-2 [Acipenser ruthenus]|uniref:Laminin subunit alpha-2 n=1 Tax=Acipenser ruthenus TaxID=7906 RepID=A0A444UCK6_ACIRT|nr:Laminin subunit alpha-2 [Acipenser ruthenus]
MTTKCTEAKGLIRMWLSLKPDQMVLPLVDKMNQRRTTNGVSFQHPEIVANVDLVSRDLLSEPFYWKLPEQFQGSMITAYGGKLNYAIYFEARDKTGRSTYEPQVIIRGGANKDKVIVHHMPALQIGQLTRHKIDMIENIWKFHGSSDVRTMTREDFMDVLFNIEYILIKASYGNLMRQSRISEISLEVAEEGESTFESERAYQIEKCECPPGYSGLSCEECVAGYYRLSSRVSSKASSSGIGSCVRCQCNGHSEICDPETSICQNCRHNTVGDRCERCAPGFYGVVRGSPDDCHPCACPLPIPSNNFSPTCVMEGFHDIRCTSCPSGYEGQYCDRCSPGFYGDPRSPSNTCQEFDECTGLLLNDLDSLGRMVMSVNLTGPLPLPYEVLNRFENITQELKATNISADRQQTNADAERTRKRAEDLDKFVKDRLQASKDTSSKLQAAKHKARHANETASDVLGRIKDINMNLMGLQKNYSKLEDGVARANAIIQDPVKNINAASAKVKDLEDEADRLLEKLKPIKELQNNLKKNISQIKELINQARKQANSIKVSVSSGGDCIRTYRPEIKKGRYNAIVLNVKTAMPDNLLFYLGSAKYSDFLAIEMRKGKVNFLWDVGSGVGRVGYPDITISDQNWYRIEASRIGRNGTISVHALEGPKASIMPSTFSGVSPSDYTILDVDANAYLFVGGLTTKIKKADAVKTTTFSGCMGETYLDSKPIGLWNYRERQGNCKGCVVSPQPPDTGGTVQFDGEGYAAVSRPTRWNPNVSTVMFKFRTFSTNALLMYFATKDMKDFMSIELNDGRIKVSYDLGSGTASVSSTQCHNDGKWKALTMSRVQKNTNVAIVDIDTNKEEKIETVSGGTSYGLNLKDREDLLWGFVNSEKLQNSMTFCTIMSLFNHSKATFVMRDVQVDEENRLAQSLPNDQSINIKKLFVGGISSYVQASMLRSINPFEGCIWNLVINTLPIDFAQSVSFENAEIGQCPNLAPPPKPLPEEEIDEVTQASEQSLPKPAVTTKPIVRQSATPAPVTCTAETEPVTLLNAKQFGLSRNSHVAMAFDDTKVKSRLIIEFEIRAEAESGLVFYMARINHADFATIQLKDGIAHLSFDLGSGNTSTSVQQKINNGQWHKVVYSINACIRNFKMLNSMLDLDNPTSNYNVGTCFVNAQTGTYFNGTGYAKTVGAYKVGTDLLIELEFRTSQRSGVLLGISGQKMDGLGIELVNGKMLFHADNGVGRFTATYEPDSQGGLCDRQWHRVVATKLKHRLDLTVDDKKVEGQSPNARSTSANTNDPVFVGGYPDGLKQFGLTLNTPFKGCIRNLKLTKGSKPQEINFSKALELQGVQPMTRPTN